MTEQDRDPWMAEVEREASELKLEDRTLEDRTRNAPPREPMASCTMCRRSVPLVTAFLVNGRATCEACVATIRRKVAEQRPRATGLLVASVSGLVGALAGAAVWAAVAAATHMEVGYVAVLVGFLAGLGVRYGAGKQRGPALQYLAVVLSVVGLVAAKYMLFAHAVVQVGRDKGVEVAYFHHVIVSHFPQALVDSVSPFDALFLFLAMTAAYRVPKAGMVALQEG